MTDPIRWSEAGDSASPIEQMLARAGQDLPMPNADKAAVWQGILGAVPAGVNATATAGPSSLLALKGIKTLAVVTTLVGLGAGGYHWLAKSRAGAEPKAAPATVASAALPSPSVVPQAAPESPRVEPSMSTTPVTQSPAPSRASQLKEESLAVMAARQALRSNDATRALHLLEQAQRRFKHGALTEEREALTIEALARTGQSARASARAQSFLTQYPRSPHAADVQRFIAK